MGIRFIEKDSTSNGNDGVVVVESDLKDFGAAITELEDMSTRSQALNWAQTKLDPPIPKAGINSMGSAYPVNKSGQMIIPPNTEVEGMPASRVATDDKAIAAYRIDIPVAQRI